MFDMNSSVPNIVARQGTVEDWIIENRSQELHAFHIHQLHFLLLDYMGRPVNENFMRDTVNVPYYNSRDPLYPSVRIRVDFRDPNIVGTFPYHCHLLEHEDRGMMGTIRVEPARSTTPAEAFSNRLPREFVFLEGVLIIPAILTITGDEIEFHQALPWRLGRPAAGPREERAA